jgi:hypothetical protein
VQQSGKQLPGGAGADNPDLTAAGDRQECFPRQD